MDKRRIDLLALTGLILAISNAPVIQALAQTSGFNITKSTSFIDDSGHYHVEGEIRNDGYSSRRGVMVAAVFYNSNYEVIGHTRGYIDSPQLLHIGDTSTFEIVFTDSEKASDIVGYTLQTYGGRAYHSSYPKPIVQTSNGVYDDFYQSHLGIESMAATTRHFDGIKGGEYSPENGNWSSLGVFVNLQSTDNEVLNYTLIMEVRNEIGITQFIHTEPGSLLPYDSYGTRYYWAPEQAGTFEIRFTAIRASDNLELLAPVLVEHVTIAP